MNKIAGTEIEKLGEEWKCKTCDKWIEPLVILDEDNEVFVCGDCFWGDVIEKGEVIGKAEEAKQEKQVSRFCSGIPEDDYLSEEDKILWEGYCC